MRVAPRGHSDSAALVALALVDGDDQSRNRVYAATDQQAAKANKGALAVDELVDDRTKHGF
jgi:hypothetical protein